MKTNKIFAMASIIIASLLHNSILCAQQESKTAYKERKEIDVTKVRPIGEPAIDTIVAKCLTLYTNSKATEVKLLLMQQQIDNAATAPEFELFMDEVEQYGKDCEINVNICTELLDASEDLTEKAFKIRATKIPHAIKNIVISGKALKESISINNHIIKVIIPDMKQKAAKYEAANIKKTQKEKSPAKKLRASARQ